MYAEQPATTSHIPTPPAPSPGVFGTKIPSTVAFAIGILLFLLPFAEVKCNGSRMASNTGLGIATGKEWKTSLDGFFGMDLDKETSKANNPKKKDPNAYAIIALAVGSIGLLLSFANARSAAGSALVSGILSAGALIGLMIDLKREVNNPLAVKNNEDFSNTMNPVKITLDFTPLFYVAVIAFLVAAFFCYKRIQLAKR